MAEVQVLCYLVHLNLLHFSFFLQFSKSIEEKNIFFNNFVFEVLINVKQIKCLNDVSYFLIFLLSHHDRSITDVGYCYLL